MISAPNRSKTGKHWFDSDDDGDGDEERSMKMSESTLTQEEESVLGKEGAMPTTPSFVVNVTRQVVVETSPR
jgi:hypothetical protein